MPPDSTVVGVPGQVVIRDNKKLRSLHEEIDLEHGKLPDPIAQELSCLQRRIIALEKKIEEMEGR